MQVHTIILKFLDRFLMQKREVHNGCHKDVHQLQSLLFQRLDSRSDLTVKEEVVIPLTRFLPSAIHSSVANTSRIEIGLPKAKKKKSQCEWYISPTLWVSLHSPDTALSSMFQNYLMTNIFTDSVWQQLHSDNNVVFCTPLEVLSVPPVFHMDSTGLHMDSQPNLSTS